jgi:hypothetical protein
MYVGRNLPVYVRNGLQHCNYSNLSIRVVGFFKICITLYQTTQCHILQIVFLIATASRVFMFILFAIDFHNIRYCNFVVHCLYSAIRSAGSEKHFPTHGMKKEVGAVSLYLCTMFDMFCIDIFLK